MPFSLSASLQMILELQFVFGKTIIVIDAMHRNSYKRRRGKIAHIYKLVPPVLCSFSPSFLSTTIFFVIYFLTSNVIPTMHLKIELY